jgi:hypothetical protein
MIYTIAHCFDTEDIINPEGVTICLLMQKIWLYKVVLIV